MPGRRGGYAPLRDYGAIGDGRTLALVARDGSIDWLCLPDLDSPSVFAGLLDASGGGRFALVPELPFRAERRYLPDTNMLETTFTTASGSVRVTDAMLLPEPGLAPGRELVRCVEGLAGEVPMRWSVDPRFGYAGWPTRIIRRLGVPVAAARSDGIAICSWEAGEPQLAPDSIGGRFRLRERSEALIVLCHAHGEPLVLPNRREVEDRLAATVEFWRRWAGERRYEGPWREAVVRGALTLKLLIYAPSGAITAAPTTSLPEALGGVRNWDYRYCWLRDSAFTLDALLSTGCAREADAFFWWLLHASQLTHPELRVLYRLDGGTKVPERELRLSGYRGSGPVRVGNAAAGQLQLDSYGELLQTAYRYASSGRSIDRDAGRRLAGLADHVVAVWREPDAGIWEVRSGERHFTQSKVMCWRALDCATQLAEEGQLPGGSLARWRSEAEAIRRFVERQCWSDACRSYVRYAGGDELDASLLLMALVGYLPPDHPRLHATIGAVRRELCRGPLVYRYLGEDGLPGEEGAFLACSFWLAEALARSGRPEDAAGQMEELLALANDVGLYAEEIDPESGEFLGNLPQALSHLALVSAAVAIGEAQGG